MAIVLLALALPALADTSTPTPIPSIPADPATGFPGYDAPTVPVFDTDAYPDSDSCQAALNSAINALSSEKLKVPSASTPPQFAAVNAAMNAIDANITSLSGVRPACLAKPAGTPPYGSGQTPGLPPGFAHIGKRPITTPANLRDARLVLICAGYSTCSVTGKARIETATEVLHQIGLARGSSAKRSVRSRLTLGHAAFAFTPGQAEIVRVPLTSAARALLRRRHSVKVRVTIVSTVNGGPSVTKRTLTTLKAPKQHH